jgi:hypothetical protein
MPDVHGASVPTDLPRANNILDDASLETSSFEIGSKEGKGREGHRSMTDMKHNNKSIKRVLESSVHHKATATQGKPWPPPPSQIQKARHKATEKKSVPSIP